MACAATRDRKLRDKAPVYLFRSSPPIRSSASSMTTEFPRITWKESAHTSQLKGLQAARTYHHAEADLLAALLFFHRLVEHNVQEYL